jgi:hypothetical protein
MRALTFDWLKLAVGVGAITGVLALVCLFSLVWVNGGSRNLALASGALVGSIVLMVIQFVFELRSSIDRDFFQSNIQLTERFLRYVNGAIPPTAPVGVWA